MEQEAEWPGIKEQSVKYLLSLIAVGALLLGISSSACAQTEVSLLVPNPFRGSLDKLVPGFESKTGYKVTVTHGRGLGTREQVARGEMFDVSILLPPYPEALASGNIDPQSATTLARLTLAVGVKKGAPQPDISTAGALKQALLAAADHRVCGSHGRKRRLRGAGGATEAGGHRSNRLEDQARRNLERGGGFCG